ncbi:TetR/AcrR family transcriptional regulator [Leucobacter sp. CSA1]|uniref:TetR/AcrR family transcriptional regulator n=1 Tax=Leucobacter chromiisoli TaxID=2796471 RepID=A0A934QAW3_9MICO|nr:TetR/AcrR family transcriptional regulator [Leucobacter chromiisoli]MBK0419937.1 TetR/AcrR family transcriptional regulator [Leucobacter chromiisoli]
MRKRTPRDERHRLLLEAGERTLVERGLHSLKLKDVASSASITPSAVLYHYPDLTDLIRDIYEEASERWYHGRKARIAGVDSPADRIRALVDSGLPTSPADASVRLLCELEGMSVRNSDYARLMQELFDQQVELYREVLERGAETGIFTLRMTALEIARALVALEDSLSYYILNDHPSLSFDHCRDLILTTAGNLTGTQLITA